PVTTYVLGNAGTLGEATLRSVTLVGSGELFNAEAGSTAGRILVEDIVLDGAVRLGRAAVPTDLTVNDLNVKSITTAPLIRGDAGSGPDMVVRGRGFASASSAAVFGNWGTVKPTVY